MAATSSSSCGRSKPEPAENATPSFLSHYNPEESNSESRSSGRGALCIACLDSLGRFGNNVIQLAAGALLADSAGLAIQVPSGWSHRVLFTLSGDWQVIPDADAFSLPVIADRVVLSHAGFRTWLETREQYVSLCAALGVARLSGRQLRAHFPQVSADALRPRADGCGNAAAGCGGPGSEPPPGRSASAPPGASSKCGTPRGGGRGKQAGSSAVPPLAGRGLWGWFQFDSSAYAPHKDRIRQLCELKAGAMLRTALRATVERWLEASRPGVALRRLICLHLRRGDFEEMPSEPLGSDGGAPAAARAPRTLRCEPPFERGEVGEAWDCDGVAFRTPMAWVAAALQSAAVDLNPGAGDVLFLCTDDPQLAAAPPLGGVSWATLGGPPAVACARSRGDALLVADWAALAAADVLLISNSTFSFTAAWMAPDGTCCLRPDPAAQAFVPFDPWDDVIFLPSRPQLPANHSAAQRRRRREEEGADTGADGSQGARRRAIE